MDVNEKIEWLEREIESLKKEVEKQDENSNVWKPELGETYYQLNGAGEVFSDSWENMECEKRMYSIGNVFETKEDAEFTVERLKVIQELKQFARPFKPGESNYSINWKFSDGILFICVCRVVKGNELHFESEEKAREAIKAVGEERIMKYYLRVGEE